MKLVTERGLSVARASPDLEFAGAEFRRYFSEVEDYLNCLNEASGRTRDDACAAAFDYQHVLQTTEPGEADQGDEGFQARSVATKETGELFLDYHPSTKKGSKIP